MTGTTFSLPERVRTVMVIPVSKETYFNTKWSPLEAPLCAYDMLYHPPDYNPKSARSDRQEPKIIRRNIWEQEFHKGIPSTTHFQHGRPKWRPKDLPTKQYVRMQGSSAIPKKAVNMILAPQECGCPVEAESVSLVDSPVCGGTYLFMVYLEWFLRGRCDIATPCKRVGTTEDFSEADFIVVGAGSAGSIVAGRLTENGNFTVLLLEAGGPEPIGVRVPSFYTTFWGNENLDWKYRTEPSDKYCRDQGSKGCNWPRGKGVGGSSLLNGMMYHRGHQQDYTDWVNEGATGWSYEEMKPYLDMTEGNKQIGSLVKSDYHSSSGPLPVQRFNYQPPAAHILLQAINETGLPIIDDMNDPTTPEGFTFAQTLNDNGQRYTTARAYLKPESERPNLRVTVHAHVTRVLFEGTKAVGVEYVNKNGETKNVTARKEVILSAGALNTPHILLLSGVGPAESLDPFNISVISDVPVGKYLRNHAGVTLYFKLSKMNNTRTLDWAALAEYLLNRGGPMSADGITQGLRALAGRPLPFDMVEEIDGCHTRYACEQVPLFGVGPLTGFKTCLVYSSLADKSKMQPDIQIFFNGFYAVCSKTGEVGELATDCQSDTVNVTANAALMLPRSDGNITLRSTDPFDSPIFNANFFDDPDDMVMAIDGVKYLEQIFNSETLQEEYGIELDPDYEGECATGYGEQWSTTWAECMVRYHTDPQNHQLGTTAIGKVTNTDLEVIGVENLRTCDAGSMPTQPTGNPQGPIMAVAEKCADLIKQKWA